MSLPSGDVTFLFSDIEGSTRLAQDLGPERWAAVLGKHDADAIVAIAEAGGVVVKHEGDGMFAAFPTPAGAVSGAVALSRAVTALRANDGPLVRVRIGVHTGDGVVTATGADYVGIDVHYAARLTAAGNGGQIVLSETTRQRLDGQIPPDTRLVDEGFRRLRDFDEPRAVHRLVVPGSADDERALRTPDLPTNMPEPVTTFVGRSRELAELADLLERTRVLTLSGPGGTGKTRLAIGVATAVRGRFPDGTWFVDLAPVRDVQLIASAIAVALGVLETPDTPVLESIREHLKGRTLLLVIDNLEQLLPAAADTVADLVRGAPHLRVIVTSREILRIAGEQEYQVPALVGGEAVELFVERARLVRPEFALTPEIRPAVEAIAARLEGLPLAMELAAARTRLFPPARILERLERSLDLLEGGARDLPERQRTLRGAIAWSVDLLSDEERTLFRRLAVFSGGWTAAAAAAVSDPDFELGIDTFAGLESLADKSLIRIVPTEHGEVRFTRHAFIREYAAELLDAAGERVECERRHAMVFLEFAESAEPHLLAEGSETWLDFIDHERHNLRSAISWSLTNGELEVGLRIAAAMWRFWHQRAELREGRTWLAELLDHPAAQARTRARARGLSAAGGLAYWAQDFDATRALYDEELSIAEELGEPGLLADVHYELGFLGMVDRDPEMLRRHEELAVELYESIGDADGVVHARQALVLGMFLKRDFVGARELETLNLAEFRQSASSYRIADSLSLLAAIGLQLDDPDLARGYLREALAVAGTVSVATLTVGVLGVAAHLALATGDLENGARLAGATDALTARAEITNPDVEILHLPDPVTSARERLGATSEPFIAEGEALTIDEAIALAARM